MTIDQRKQVIAEFLQKCNAYATEKLTNYRREAAGLTGLEALDIQDKIHRWTIYRAFNEYAIEELANDELDSWFD